MPTWNYELQHLTLDEIEAVSLRFLMGWHDPKYDGHSFRIKGLNTRRQKLGLEPLTKDWSVAYRVEYVTTHFSQDEIVDTLKQYLSEHKMDEFRWSGIELFDCRFGGDYVKVFKQIVGAPAWRKIAEETRVQKLVDTQMAQYGGVGVAGKQAYDKMIHTKSEALFERMQNADVDDSIFGSDAERIVFHLLVDRFGRKDVFYQYGIHPADKRYPYPCDFYIRSLDLFIELNVHYSHGDHWFDATNHDDVLRKEHILEHGNPKMVKSLKTWCEFDLMKRDTAKANKLNYLVFWDGKHLHADIKGDKKRHYVPRLLDFYMWYKDYDCDVTAFLQDHPENTY